ncbi:glycosyltransferase [Clostridium sp. MSJ-8]|uniref:glycosyltransferase n=1 Tax=Clostridium sp. MSJ-8 TaxID=2841510 RepID=UPI001C0F20C8|nr:glycosyltransferase [Clostridium sp. MSJ-8]MBU5486639.1 glycosyltransferase [Clostridium sp. MSJ-8]
MNIGIFTDTYYPEVNGVANSTYQLKKSLEELGHIVYVFTVSNPNVIEYEKNVIRMHSIPFIFLKDRRISYSLVSFWRKKIEKYNLDIIHTQTEFSLGHMGKRIARYLRIPMIHTYHTIYEDYTHYLKLPMNKSIRNVVKKLSRHCCDNAECVIVPTDKVKNLLHSYNVKRDIIVQPTGIELDKFTNIDFLHVEQLKKKYNISDSDNTMIYVGRLAEEKNLKEIINFMPYIKEIDYNVKLIVVGSGPYRETLESCIEELKLENNVIFTGSVPWENIQDYYALGKVFISASTSETQGLTYIEALATGRPILVRNDKCLEGVLQQGINGYGYSDLMQFIMYYKKLFLEGEYNIMAHNAVSSIDAYSSKRFAQNIEEIYNLALTYYNRKVV